MKIGVKSNMTEDALRSKEAELMELKNNYEAMRSQLASRKEKCETSIVEMQERSQTLNQLTSNENAELQANDRFVEL